MGMARRAASSVLQSTRIGFSAAVATTWLAIPQPASAAPTQADIQALEQQISALRSELDGLQDQLRQVKEKLAPAAAPGALPPAAASRLPSSTPDNQPHTNEFLWTNSEPGELPLVSRSPTYWRIPGSETEVRFSGYIRMGAYKDLVDNIDSYKFRVGDIHPRGSPLRGQTGNIEAQLRLSRISFDSITPTKLGDLRTVLAVDFAGAEPKTYEAEALQNNGYHLRLTHAFANLGPFALFGIRTELLFGQTWSNFLDDPDTAETLDPSGPASVPSERQPQVRYTMRFGAHALSFALENPIGEYQLPGTPLASSVNNTSTTNRWPDMSVRYVLDKAGVHAQLSGIIRRFEATDGVGHASSTLGYGVLAGGSFTIRGRDQVGGLGWYGEGIGKFIPDEFGSPNGFAVSGYGTDLVQARTQASYGASLWLRHFWAPLWRSNFALGYSRQLYAPFIVAAPDQASALRTAHINLIYTPLPMFDFGMELEYGRKTFRRALNLGDADAMRLDFNWRARFN